MNTTVWLISFTTSNGERVQKVHTHNCVADYRLLVGGANVQEIDCAAVAELIERARALRSAHCAFQDWKAKAPKRYPAPRSILEMNAHAKAMLFAALDRVGGAK